MTPEHTIDAFVDGERVDAAALDTALGSPEGRAYLVDALSLRRLLQETHEPVAAAPARRAYTLHFYARAAVVALALLGLGYAAGTRSGSMAGPTVVPTTNAQASDAPEPTRVIELTPGVNWHESKGGD